MPTPDPGRAIVRAALLVVTSLVAAACGGAAADAPRAETCVDWVPFAAPADAVAAADLVVRTTGPAAASGTVALLGADATMHAVPVEQVVAGTGARPGEVLDVASTPETCTGDGPYPGGDPLDAPGTLLVLLERDADSGSWRTLTPGQGVVAAADGTVPASWPADAGGSGS